MVIPGLLRVCFGFLISQDVFEDLFDDVYDVYDDSTTRGLR